MFKLKELSKKYNIYILFCLTFSIALPQKLSTIILILLLSVSILSFKKIKFNKDFLPLVILYIVYVFFEIVHAPIDYSFFQKKATLIVLPFIFMVNNYNQKDIKKALVYFVYGVIIACLICYGNALISSISFVNGFNFNSKLIAVENNGFLESSMFGGNHFFGDNFSIFHQSIYFSLQINIAAVILLFTDFFKTKYKYLLLVFFGLVIFQISNRVNILIYICIIVSTVFYIKNKKIKLIAALLVVTLALIFLLGNSRTKEVLKRIETFEYVLDREAEDSFGTRLLVWDASLEVIKNNPLLGVGVSNSYNALKKVYKEKRYVIPFRNRLNSHNQFLQIFIECGILGILVFLLIQVKLLSFNNKFKLLSIYVFLVFNLNFLFESVFNRYSGLICCVIFYCCLLILKNKTSKKQTIISQ